MLHLTAHFHRGLGRGKAVQPVPTSTDLVELPGRTVPAADHNMTAELRTVPVAVAHAESHRAEARRIRFGFDRSRYHRLVVGELGSLAAVLGCHTAADHSLAIASNLAVVGIVAVPANHIEALRTGELRSLAAVGRSRPGYTDRKVRSLSLMYRS